MYLQNEDLWYGQNSEQNIVIFMESLSIKHKRHDHNLFFHPLPLFINLLINCVLLQKAMSLKRRRYLWEVQLRTLAGESVNHMFWVKQHYCYIDARSLFWGTYAEEKEKTAPQRRMKGTIIITCMTAWSRWLFSVSYFSFCFNFIY